MGRVPEPKEISVRVPKISGRTDGEQYPNRKLSGTQFQVPNHFSSGFWLPNYPIFVNLLFLPNNCTLSPCQGSKTAVQKEGKIWDFRHGMTLQRFESIKNVMFNKVLEILVDTMARG